MHKNMQMNKNAKKDAIYIALICDIVDSKKIKDRNRVQKELNYVLKKINEEYKKYIASKFLITLGDEFQGLLFKNEIVFDIIDKIIVSMPYIKLRFGIGVGRLNTDYNKKMAIGADGPCYYFARDAINFLKQNTNKKNSVTMDVLIKSKNNDIIIDAMNALLMNMTLIRNRWSLKQYITVSLYNKFNGIQNKIAKHLNVNQSTVNRSIESAKYNEYLYNFNIVKLLFNKNIVEE